MAGAGYKLFNTGDVLLASEVNTYLQQQTVMVFASSTARTTALSGVLAEGMMSYLQDTNSVEVYNGSAWVSVGSTGDITGVTAGTGISGGGTSGDVTITNSMATAIDAKGDLIVGTGADTFSRLAVGATNGHTLQVDSSTATGLKWAAASSTPTFVGCAAISTSPTNVANNTWTAVALQSERFDTDSFHDNSTNNSRITIPAGKGGYYLVIYRSGFESITTNDCIMRLYKNGSIFDEGYTYSTISKTTSPYIKADMHSSAIVSLAAGDYIQLYVLQASGSSSDTWNENRLSVQFLGA